MPMCFPLQPRILKRIDAVESAAWPEHQRVGRVVVGVGGLHQVVAHRHADDHVAAQGIQRVAHEADHLRIVGVAGRLAEFAREQLGQLVLEPFARFVGERQVARVGADPERLGVDQFHRCAETGSLGAARPAISSRATIAAAAKRNATIHHAADSGQPMHSSSALVNASGFGACFSGRPRPMASSARARR